MERAPRPTWVWLIPTAVMLAAPWLWLAWATRPGAERPLVRDVATLFFLFNAVALQSPIERIVERKHRRLGAHEVGLALLSAALLSWRIHEPSYLLIFASLLPFFALVHFCVERMFRSRGCHESQP